MAHSFADLRCERMALETVPKDLRHLRACLLCSLVKVSVGDLVVRAHGRPSWGKEGGIDLGGTVKKKVGSRTRGGGRVWEGAGSHRLLQQGHC